MRWLLLKETTVRVEQNTPPTYRVLFIYRNFISNMLISGNAFSPLFVLFAYKIILKASYFKGECCFLHVANFTKKLSSTSVFSVTQPFPQQIYFRLLTNSSNFFISKF